ncbi:MAG: hypothetical protein M4579_005900 [Chaenotheca gracillima]|nr:MAG: hypothetical protein M4579_005900 [Chaenotheca gracillima]
MSEYWKSTPKFWCKYCKTYVRDSKLERQQHDATPRHQGNLKRFLRDLHRGQEREARDSDRAKQEVDRLNGVVSGTASSTPPVAPDGPSRKPRGPPASVVPQQQVRQPTAEERKKQLAQLAEMGIAIPQEYRGEMAMAGEWQTLSERLIGNTEDDDESKTKLPRVVPRKRKLPGEEEEEEEERAIGVKRGWGTTIKTYPGRPAEDDEDLDALLSGSKRAKDAEASQGPDDGAELERPHIKHEDSIEAPTEAVVEGSSSTLPLKEEDREDAPPSPGPPAGSIFKKRKAKPLRQKG